MPFIAETDTRRIFRPPPLRDSVYPRGRSLRRRPRAVAVLQVQQRHRLPHRRRLPARAARRHARRERRGNGREAPGVDGREEGYLFWAAWLQHNGAAIFSTSDANGPFRPVTLGGTCGVLRSLAGETPPLNQVLLPALTDPKICGTS